MRLETVMDDKTSQAVRVLLVDDHPVVRAGLHLVLEEGGRLGVVGEASTGREAVLAARQLRPDVVVMDLGLPDISGLEATRAIKADDPSVRVLIVSMFSDEEHVLGMLDAGVDGYLLKQSSPSELREGILRVVAGERVLHQKVVQALVTRAMGGPTTPAVEALTTRELEVIRLLADGATSKEMAVALGLAAKTVENHRSRILNKLGAANSAAAVRAAIVHGLLSPPSGGGATR